MFADLPQKDRDLGTINGADQIGQVFGIHQVCSSYRQHVGRQGSDDDPSTAGDLELAGDEAPEPKRRQRTTSEKRLVDRAEIGSGVRQIGRKPQRSG
ncbi:MAG TPA: hypothetical protein VFN76_05065 [Candidatus Limnocylindria bacterium]|nr:hypothetical protein [Candidatus Limnocylindria bacterium]